MIDVLRNAILENVAGNDFECKLLDSAIIRLSSLPDSESSRILLALAKGDNAHYRAYAAIIAAKLYSPVTQTLAEGLLGDTEFFVRLEACNAARVMRLFNMADLVAHTLATDNDEMVRDAAALALSKIGNPNNLPLMRQAAQNEKAVDHEGVPVQTTILHSIQDIIERG